MTIEIETPPPTYEQVISGHVEPISYPNQPPFNPNNNRLQIQDQTAGYPITTQPYHAQITNEIADDQQGLHQLDGQQSQSDCIDDCCGDDCCTDNNFGNCCGDDCCGDKCCTNVVLKGQQRIVVIRVFCVVNLSLKC